MANKFRVGDIVRGIKDSCYAVTNERMTRGEVTKILNTKTPYGNDMVVKIIRYPDIKEIGLEYPVNSKFFELVKHKNETIVIYRKGDEVIALDKSIDKKATAKCSPEDSFDFYTGAKLAFERLIKEPKPLNTKICITKTNSPCLTTGKIYEIKDGRFKDDIGIYSFPIDDPLVDIGDLKAYFSEKDIRKNGRTGHFGKTEFVELVD